MKQMKHLQTKQELEEVLRLHSVVIIDIYGTWCPPCKLIGPKFEKMASEHSNVYAAKVNVDEAEDLVREFGVSAIPTFIKFVNGKRVDNAYGNDEKKLRELFQN